MNDIHTIQDIPCANCGTCIELCLIGDGVVIGSRLAPRHYEFRQPRKLTKDEYLEEIITGKIKTEVN